MMLTSETIVQATPEQISSRLAESETIILGLQQSAYFGLNEVGSQIWQQIQRPTPVATIVERLLTDYEVSQDYCLTKTLDFLQQLHQEGLLSVVPAAGATDSSGSEAA